MHPLADNVKISASEKLRAYLELMRPANIVTAFADILAGFAAAGGITLWQNTLPIFPLGGIVWLLIATFGLYGGGVVFNDVFDADIDAQERPERAIPSGRATLTGASLLGALLLLGGIIAAFQVNFYSGAIAIIVAALALVYDRFAKHSIFWGPLFMGLCRGGNLLLGCSIVATAVSQYWFLGILPVLYIAAITLVSQGEVHGGSKRSGYLALLMLALVMIALLVLSVLPEYSLYTALPFVLLLAIIVIPPFVKAAFDPIPEKIKTAVKRGVLSLIILNTVIIAGFSGLLFAGLVLLLLPISMMLSRLFKVT